MNAVIKAIIVVYSAWILNNAQVEGYFHDGLNPVKLDLSVWHQRSPRVATHGRTNEQLTCEKPNIYICEEPPSAIPIESGKNCNFRNVWYHEQVFRWVAGRGCLLYTPDFLYAAGTNTINLNAGCVYGNLFAPCLEIAKEDGTCGCYPFDPAFEEVATTVHDALVPSARGRWEKCFYAASDCCSHYMDANSTNDQCIPTFDGWSCWSSAESGSIASAVCPDFAYSNTGPSCEHYSYKECHKNGSWELQTDYSTCSVTPRLVRRYRFYIAMLTFSIVACLPAVFIFFFYKRLRVTRVALHRNLLIAIILRNILVIISRSEIYIDELTNAEETVMSGHGIACRVLAIAERIAGNAVFVCMLIEGIYLHRLIVAVFRQKLNIHVLYGVGAVIVVLPVIAWAVVMGLMNDHSCWMVYTVDNVQWILDAPRILMLLLNTILFVDVLRVLLTKIRNTENANQLNTAKATLFLMPIFGTQFIFTAFRPNTSQCTAEQAYYFVAYTVEGLQGFVVALLYCYINKEVHGLIKITYKKTEIAVTSRIRGSNYPRMSSVGPNTDRRFTYSTGINSNNADDIKNQYTTMKPKLHVAEIISIQASERLAEILDPVYETIDNGLTNDGYDCLERSDIDNDSGFIPNRYSKIDEYYGFTNASSVSINCQDWLKCASPAMSVYNYSSTACNIMPTENADNDIHKEKSIAGKQDAKKGLFQDNGHKNVAAYENIEEKKGEKTSDVRNEIVSDDAEVDYGNCDTMLDEIMQYIETNSKKDPVKLDAELLSPNRPADDKIVFVDE